MGVVALALTVAPTFASSAPHARPAAAKCNRAAAIAVLREHPKLDPFPINLPAHVLCGPFLGRRSQAMIVVFEAETCNPDFGWAAFRLTAGRWHPVFKYPNGQLSLAPVGSDIKETVGILRPGDARCKSTGGTRTRTWHWNGSRFVVSAWTTHLPPTPHTSCNRTVEYRPGLFAYIAEYVGMTCTEARNFAIARANNPSPPPSGFVCHDLHVEAGGGAEECVSGSRRIKIDNE